MSSKRSYIAIRNTESGGDVNKVREEGDPVSEVDV
jgi:hypothetical protein